MLVFDRPLAFLLLALLPLGIWLRHRFPRRGGQVAMAFAAWQGKAYRPIATMVRLVWWLANGLFWAAILSLIVALAGPVHIDKTRVYLSRGLEIMFVVDISPSMAASDEPGRSRLAYAQATIKEFLTRRSNDEIGLVAFGSDAALYCPPTIDYQTLSASIDRLRVMDLGEGTAIGLGLSVAAAHIKDTSSRNRVLVLLSDGDNNYGEIGPETATAMIAANGIRVYTIGIGSDQEVEIEYEDPAANKVYRGTYGGKLDEALLQSIARRSGGAYFHARTGSGLADILTTIDDLERPELRIRQDVVRTSHQAIFLIIAFVALLVEMAIRRLLLRELS